MVNLWSFGAIETASHRALINIVDNNEFFLNRPGIAFNVINDGYARRVKREPGCVYGVRITDGALEKLAYLEEFDFVVYSSDYALSMVTQVTDGKYRYKSFHIEDAVDTPRALFPRNQLPQAKYLSYCNPENLSEELFQFDVTIYTSGINHPMVREWRYDRIGEYNWFDEAIILHKSPHACQYRIKSLNRLAQSFYFDLDVTSNYELFFSHEEIGLEFRRRMTPLRRGLWRLTDTRTLFEKCFSHELLRKEYNRVRELICK